MITKLDLQRLYEWASNTNFPLRNEVITSKYMGYGMKICHIKIGKKRKMYPNKNITRTVLDIFERDDIYGAYYLYYPPNMKAKPHVDYNPFKTNYLRVQIPVKIPNNNKNNECYIEWVETKEIVYWKQGKVELFDVEKLHQGANDSNESMEFLYIDIDPNTKVEL
tara:strand:+ start:2177 stop:2671 length:495 start_codon:yes stop_codon:yes gene_type:complete